jgi:hypothetical protein
MSIAGDMARVRDTLEGLYQHFTKEGLEAALKAGDEAATAQRLGALLELNGRSDLARIVGRRLEAKPIKFTTLSGRRRAGTYEVNGSFKVWLDEAQGRSGA